MAINTTTTLDSIELLDPPFQFSCKLKMSLAEKHPDRGFERKAFTRQNFPDSNVFRFKVPTLDSGFKISGDMTKPGCFHFRFFLLCVNGKTNPVLKVCYVVAGWKIHGKNACTESYKIYCRDVSKREGEVILCWHKLQYSQGIITKGFEKNWIGSKHIVGMTTCFVLIFNN